ncbi:MAG TPA: DUF721 domain-containing protein, partial [Polyangia bacterium]
MRRTRRKGARPSTQPRPAGALLDGTFRWLKLDDNARSFRAMRAFATAAGPRIGEHARGERLRGSILYVRCDSSAWTQHLHVMKQTLLERLHKTPGGEVVAELRFNVGPLDEVAGWEAPTPAPASVEPAAPAELPEEVARALGAVEDPLLRDEL